MNISISIITIVYNCADTIEETIKSVVNQDYPHVEYIVIDGGSTDGTVDILQKYTNQIDTWISEPDDGISDAFNKGLSYASGDIVGLINSGDYYLSGALSTVAKESSKGDILYGNMLNHDENGTTTAKRHSSYKADNLLFKAKMGKLYHPTIFIKKEWYDRFQFNTECKFAMDYELLLRLKIQGATFYYIDAFIASMYPYGISDKHYGKARGEVIWAYKNHLGKGMDIHILIAYLEILRTKTRSTLEKHGAGKIVALFRKIKKALR